MAHQGNPAGAYCADSIIPFSVWAPHLYLSCLIWGWNCSFSKTQSTYGNKSMESLVQNIPDHD